MAQALAKGAGALGATLAQIPIDPLWLDLFVEYRQHGRYPEAGGMNDQDALYFPVMHALLAEVTAEEERVREKDRKRREAEAGRGRGGGGTAPSSGHGRHR